jgi:hypothetical protein
MATRSLPTLSDCRLASAETRPFPETGEGFCLL